MDRFILLGTSHACPRFNPMGLEFKKVFNKNFTDRGCPALGIETYFPRILSILDEYVNEKLFFIAEIPCSGRYQNYFINEKIPYSSLDIIDKNFWPEWLENTNMAYTPQYMHHILYYNESKLLNWKGKKFYNAPMDHILRFVAGYNHRILQDLILNDVIFINSFLKQQGHEVAWFIVNNDLKHSQETLTLMEKYNVQHIAIEPLWTAVEKKYNLDIEVLKKDTKLFPDGSHLNKEDWIWWIHKYFIPYFQIKNFNVERFKMESI